MLTITVYNSGALKLDNSSTTLSLTRDQAHRLIMGARMHSVDEFIEKVPSLIADATIVKNVRASFEKAEKSERWNLKETFARIPTVAKGYEAKNPDSVSETIVFPLSP